MSRGGSRLFVLFAAVGLVAAACQRGTTTTTGEKPTFPAGSTMEQIQQKGKVVIGVKYDIPQIGFLNPATNQPEGFEIEIGKIVAEGLGVQPEFQEAISANRIPFLREDKVDLIISTMTITEQRRQEIDFSIVYYVAGQTLLVKRGSGITDVGALDEASAPVCSAAGSTSEKNIATVAPNAQVVQQRAYSECFQLLRNDQVKAVTTDDVILLQFVKQDPQNFALVGGRFSLEPYGIGIKKGREDLLRFVDETLKEIKTDGTWEKLYDEWIKPVTGTEGSPPPDDVKAVAPSPQA